MLARRAPPFPLRVIVQDAVGRRPRESRSRGGAGRYLLFLDDDVVVEKRSSLLACAALRSSDRRRRIGRIGEVSALGCSALGSVASDGLADRFDRLAAGRQPRFSDAMAGTCPSRDDFLEVRGFATDLLVEHDVELGYRLTPSGNDAGVYPTTPSSRGPTADTLGRFVAVALRRGGVGVKLAGTRHATAPSPRRRGRASERWIALPALALSSGFRRRLLAVGARLGPSETPPQAAGSRSCTATATCAGVRRQHRPRTWVGLQRGTAILMYHAIGREDEPASRYVLPASRFRRRLAWLRLRRYNVIGLEEFVLSHRRTACRVEVGGPYLRRRVR